jgi:hypothetical protein
MIDISRSVVTATISAALTPLLFVISQVTQNACEVASSPPCKA